MSARAKEGACLEALVRMALPLCRAAERQCPRTGPGRKPEIPDWAMAALIMVAMLAKKKSKSSQYRYLWSQRKEFLTWLGTKKFPSRSTYFDRYRRAHRIFAVAIRLQGEAALREGVADAETVAADKSLIAARGPVRSTRSNRSPPRGCDRDAGWGYSEHDHWVYGYGYEVVVTAGKNSTVFPLLASVDPANRHEGTTFGEKIAHLPEDVRNVLVDSGYDKNEYGERVEYDEQGRRTGRRYVCPPIRRFVRQKHPPGTSRRCHSRQVAYDRRQRRIRFYNSREGRRLHKRRSRTVEPFNEWFKSLFELEHHMWHRGLDNNRTQILAAIFAYQLLVRWNYRCGRKNGQVKWLVDTL
jgi:hypothetical protein